MPYGIPSIPASRFPNDKPPTLFHPASPKLKPVNSSKTTSKTASGTSTKDIDTASLASTSTFSSTVGLLKSKLHHKEKKSNNEKQ
ncbi:hypothetical protein F5884DRAFT_859419 [Xylogone sp. PMI_703]|nr:hypothetical protein F5884DRAFT_859419 [Xylogone sp. PMI_703]